MGVFFVNKRNEVIWSRSETYAAALIELTKAASSFYGFPVPISDIEASESVVDDEVFCALVEAAFAKPEVLFFAWAQSAAAIYECIKCERFEWVWDQNEIPLIDRSISRIGRFAPDRLSNKVIGSLK